MKWRANMQHTISVLVENKFGVLARVAGLFSGRGYNIESLTVSPTFDPSASKMTIVTTGDNEVVEQIEKQVSKLIDVIKVTDLTGGEFIARELALVKVSACSAKRAEIMQITEIFGGKIVNVYAEELTVELSGSPNKVDAFVDLVRPFGLIELARTGRVAVSRRPGATESY